ncbi:MAG: response regulator [Saprospiraceae bacterium]|nr:response regulator [Saprospiraceae bacterium]
MSAKNNKISILALEPNPSDIALLESYLKDLGAKIELHKADSLNAGFSILSQQDIDLVFMELNLKDSNGFRTITAYLESVVHVPVVVVTSVNNEIIINQSIKAGVQDYLIKGQFDAKSICKVALFSVQRFKVQNKLEETAKELEGFKKRFLEAQKMARFGTWEMDVVSNKMTWADEVYRIFGIPKGTFLPMLSEYLKFVPAEDRTTVAAFFEEAGRDGELHSIEHRILVDNFNIRDVLVQAMVKIEEGGHRVMLVGSIWDITERKTSERLLIEKAISSQTASIQEEVLADLGFQVRTPLSSIINLLFLLGNTETSSQQEMLVTNLKTSVGDLSMSVNNLLNFSLMVTDTVKVEDEDIILADFLAGAINVVRIKAETAKLNLRFMPDGNLPEKITADPRKITQIIYNLIEHSLRQSEQGDDITIRASCEPVADSLELEIRIINTRKQFNANDLLELNNVENIIREVLSNGGKEMTPKKKLVGLAISSKLVKSLDGELKFLNLETAGSEIMVKLPVKPSKKIRFQVGEKPTAPMRILMVEDHFLNQLATKKVLLSWSEYVTVDIAENGQLGYEAVAEKNYDLVLMDIQMPVMNGLESAKKIREFSQVPIIALTANSSKQEEEKCLEIGMNDYLSKPFKPYDLYERIMSVLMTVEA